MRKLYTDSNGFTLVELIIVVIIIGIIAGIAAMNFGSTLETIKFDTTLREMEALTRAMVGNPGVYNDGARTDFGYVGDIGNLPPNLDALVINPGLTTWQGPYIEQGLRDDDFKKDAWNSPYQYQDTLLRSIGSGQNIDRVIAPSSIALTGNTIVGFVVDADGTRPNAVYVDSMTVTLRYPSGGSYTAPVSNPDESGQFSFSNVPVGNHRLQVIYLPDDDTLNLTVTVYPGRDAAVSVAFPADLW